MSIESQLQELGFKIVGESNGQLVCHCPNPKGYHEQDDRHPSFYFDPETELFNCFAGCVHGRGMHQLIFQVTGKSVKKTVQLLPEIRRVNLYTEQKKLIPSIPDLPLAVDNPGEAYLRSDKRKFTKETILKWRLMYDAEESAIVIPLEDAGFTYRYFGKKNLEKYKNVRGTKATQTLFGLSRFKDSNHSAILVEGAFDVIWCHQCGIENTLGVLHANIEYRQIQALKRVADEAILMLDSDAGGRTAEETIAAKLKWYGFLLKQVTLPRGSDPNDLDKETLLDCIKSAKRFCPTLSQNAGKILL